MRAGPWRGGRAGLCWYCGKLTYRDRRAAKRSMRELYPAQVGHGMAAYRCQNGGSGWHIGHRVGPAALPTPQWPAWTDAAEKTGCTGCTQVVEAGEPVAWLGGRPLCFDCGDLAEREAIAVRGAAS